MGLHLWPSNPLAPSGSAFPPAPPQSSVLLGLPRPFIPVATPWSPGHSVSSSHICSSAPPQSIVPWFRLPSLHHDSSIPRLHYVGLCPRVPAGYSTTTPPTANSLASAAVVLSLALYVVCSALAPVDFPWAYSSSLTKPPSALLCWTICLLLLLLIRHDDAISWWVDMLCVFYLFKFFSVLVGFVTCFSSVSLFLVWFDYHAHLSFISLICLFVCLNSGFLSVHCLFSSHSYTVVLLMFYSWECFCKIKS